MFSLRKSLAHEIEAPWLKWLHCTAYPFRCSSSLLSHLDSGARLGSAIIGRSVRLGVRDWASYGQQAPVNGGQIKSLKVTFNTSKYLLTWILLRIRDPGACFIGNR